MRAEDNIRSRGKWKEDNKCVTEVKELCCKVSDLWPSAASCSLPPLDRRQCLTWWQEVKNVQCMQTHTHMYTSLVKFTSSFPHTLLSAWILPYRVELWYEWRWSVTQGSDLALLRQYISNLFHPGRLFFPDVHILGVHTLFNQLQCLKCPCNVMTVYDVCVNVCSCCCLIYPF